MDQYEHVRNYPLNVVLAALGFETFKYRKAGTEGYGKCAICLPKKNTTAFSFDDSGKFHCFACGAKGRGAIDLVIAIRKCTFKDAVSFLEGISGAIAAKPTESPGPEPTPALTENKHFSGASYAKYAVPSPWLTARGLAEDTLKKFGVFQYCNPARKSAYANKVMIPVHRFADSELVAYLARDTNPDAEVKYVFPKGFQKSLEVFGASLLKDKRPHRVVYLVESPLCVMKFSQYGLPAVSTFGWSVSEAQAAILADLARGYIYLPDRDKAHEIGQSLLLLSRRCWVKCPELPAQIDDPERLTADQVAALT